MSCIAETQSLRQYLVRTQGCVGAQEMLFELRIRRRKGKSHTDTERKSVRGAAVAEQ